MRSGLVLSFVLVLCQISVAAQERAYFVTYDHYLEEPGNLEVAVTTTTGLPSAGRSAYTAPWLELEYGLTGWWTAELYLEGVTTQHEGSGFTGWRLENRFRPLKNEHRVNPVIYVEFEDINEASRIQKEIVGSGPLAFEAIADLRGVHARELEGKVILSSVVGPWNVAENFILEKNLSEDEGVEFGYAVGISRSLGELANGSSCRFCPENFVLGVEAYGGLGNSVDRTLDETRHFIAPVLGWHVTDRSTLKLSVGFGLTEASDPHLLRLGWMYELPVRGGRR